MAAGGGGEAAWVRAEVRALLEARQRRLRARIAACEELTAEMAALRAALQDRPALPAAPPGSAGPCGGMSKAGAEGSTRCLVQPEGP